METTAIKIIITTIKDTNREINKDISKGINKGIKGDTNKGTKVIKMVNLTKVMVDTITRIITDLMFETNLRIT